MRIPTVLEVLRRASLGESATDIARDMHLGKDAIADALRPSGYPDVVAVAKYREWYRLQDVRAVWDAAETIRGYMVAIRVDPQLVHAATDELDLQEARKLLAVAVAMLPQDLEPAEALAWMQNPRRKQARKATAA